MKALFKETTYTEFWLHLLNVPEYRSIAKKEYLFSFKCPQRIYAKVIFIVCVRSNLEKEIQSRTSIHWWGLQLKKIPFLGLECCLIVCNSKKSLKISLSWYLLYYAKACNEFAGPISASFRPGNTPPLEETLQRWRAVDNTVSNLTGPRFEHQTFCSRNERVTTPLTGRCQLR